MPASAKLSCMSLHDCLSVGRIWLSAGGRPQIDIAALEPLLWRDGKYRIADLVKGMRDLGFTVALTTNGQFLEQHVSELARAGLAKLRVSWHTTNPDLFRQISATGHYQIFLKGVDAALQAQIPTTFNRLLLRGHTDDLAEHIALIDERQSKMKLYDLLWTPQIADLYERYYVNAIEAAEAMLSRLSRRWVQRSGQLGRRRVEFELEHGGVIEAKESENIDRDPAPCSTCVAKRNCLEAFGDYVRIEPSMLLYFCYLRRDIGIHLKPLLMENKASALIERMDTLTSGGGELFLKHSRLRFIVVPMCNFNCGFPGHTRSWCHKATGNFNFPPRRVTALGTTA